MSAPPRTSRLARRETRSSRTVASVATAVVLILILAWLGTEAVLASSGQPPLLATPTRMAEWLVRLPAATLPWGLVAAGAALALLGLLLLVLAVSPGTRPRRIMASDRAAIVVDDDVLAAAIDRAARQAGALLPEQVSSRIRRRRVQVRIRPIPGGGVDEPAVRAAVEQVLASSALQPEPKLDVIVSDRGKVGP
ncbi:hypothetical protein GCM10023081_29350 [Arthrobacter ginkgonis]|uniref:DUF6286 domain-containing protein n=1 Tax=Arthrobacter ginkgonis TaxID=1630594 RepID=A0ABP7CGD4_9MICC